MANKVTISLCIITLNEENFLSDALKNASNYVDEIIVVDGGSTDKTVEIAQSFGAKVFNIKWEEDFASQRNKSLKKATKKWILVMDADEVYEDALLSSLQRLANNKLGIDAYGFPRKNYINGKLTSAYPDIQMRFLRNNGKIKYKGIIHEQMIGYSFSAVPLKFHIIHKKTAKRQRKQNSYYQRLDKKYQINYYKNHK